MLNLKGETTNLGKYILRQWHNLISQASDLVKRMSKDRIMGTLTSDTLKSLDCFNT